MVAGLNRSVAHSITRSELGDRCKNIFGSALSINRLKLELAHLGNRSSFSLSEWITYQVRSLYAKPLQTSRVRQVREEPPSEGECAPADNTPSKPKDANTKPQVENLDVIYKTIGQSFREAKDQGGVNEAWYREHSVILTSHR